MKAFLFTGLVSTATIFGFVIDPMPFLSEHWLIFGGIVALVTMAAGSVGPIRIIKWFMPTPGKSRQTQPAYQVKQTAPNGVLDFVRLRVGEAQQELLKVKAEETRKTEEAKRQAMLMAEQRKAADHAGRLAMRKPVIHDTPAIALPRLTLKQAIEQSTERAWVVGQEAEIQGDTKYKATGNLLTFDYRTNHVAIIGATGSGKTESTAELMVYYARRFGLHVIVLDGKRGIDWERFNGAVEWHSTTIETVEHQLGQLTRVFQARWDEMRAAQVNKIYDLPGKRKRTLFIVFEEFGYLWTLVKQDKTLYAKLSTQIDDLFRLGRAAGIVLCLMDQAPEEWSKQMRANAKFVVCYKLNGNAANTFNEYFAGKLPTSGTFTQSNVFYDAWWFDSEMDLKRHCERQTKRYISEQPVHSPVHVHSDEYKLHEMNSEQPVHDFSGGGQNGQNSAKNVPPSAVRVFMNTGSWDEVAASFKQLYPQSGITDLARVMADIVNDGRPYKNFKSTSAQYFRQETN